MKLIRQKENCFLLMSPNRLQWQNSELGVSSYLLSIFHLCACVCVCFCVWFCVFLWVYLFLFFILVFCFFEVVCSFFFFCSIFREFLFRFVCFICIPKRKAWCTPKSLLVSQKSSHSLYPPKKATPIEVVVVVKCGLGGASAGLKH